MLILTIETCTDTSTLGLVRDGAVLVEAAFPSRFTLAQRMILRLEWMLAEAGLQRKDLQAVAVSLGPGSFTGVRIGAAAAKTLAQFQGIPLVGVPTLEALAYPFRELGDALLAPLVNARRKQAYLALFRAETGGLLRVTDDLLLAAEPFAGLLAQHRHDGERVLFIGQIEGLPAEFHTALPFPSSAIRSLVTPHALAALAETRLANGAGDDPMTLAPIYLRSAAE